ncbi:hypothetical protein HaLaN_28270, partial [Haematococcus lacustris]
MPTALLPVAASIANQLLSKLAAVLDLYDRRPLDTDDVPVLASGQLWTMGSLLHISSLYSSVRTHAEVLVYKAPMPSSSGLLISSCAAPVVDNTTTPHNSVAQRRRRRALASTHLPEVQELVKPLLPSQPWPAASANHGAELQQWHQSRQVLQGDVSPAPEESSSSTSSSDVDSSDGNSPGSDLEESSMEESSSDGSGSSIDTGGEEGDWGSPSGTTAPPQSVLAFMDMPSTAVYEGPLDANTRQQWEYQALGRFDESGRLLGPQFPRTHLLLLYRLDWEELIAVALALRRLHGFSSGPGNLDDYIAVDEVAPPLGVRLPAGQGSVDVRRWPQPNSLCASCPEQQRAQDGSVPGPGAALQGGGPAGRHPGLTHTDQGHAAGSPVWLAGHCCAAAGLAAGPCGHVAADQQPSRGRGLAAVRPAGQPGPAPLQPVRAPAKLLSPQPPLCAGQLRHDH